MNKNTIVYDLETQKSFAEVGGFGHNEKLGISYLGLYSYSQGEYFGFFEKDLPKLETIIEREKPTIVGFNSINFDNQVLQPYFTKVQMADLPQVDILADIFNTLGFRMKLESVAQATLGEGKSGSGLDALRYYREGNFDALAKYCMDDVRITRDIYEYGMAHGFILYTSGGDLQRMPVDWSNEDTVVKRIERAYQAHQRMRITYLQINEDNKERIDTEIDILEMSDKSIEVYCHVRNNKHTYHIERILSAEIMDENYSYQASLL
ncbi:MAG: ribonuclease H-like domain-containing protein [bacterium]|nr:ribonuclease H-like domain-containing protein [bacterium]